MGAQLKIGIIVTLAVLLGLGASTASAENMVGPAAPEHSDDHLVLVPNTADADAVAGAVCRQYGYGMVAHPEQVLRGGILFSCSPPFRPAAAGSRPFGQQAIKLGTTTGFELGGQISNYRYQEHVVANTEFMNETGPHFGITGTATKAFDVYGHGVFVTGDGRFAYGSNDYEGSGTKSGVDDFLWDVRLLGGADFVFDNAASSGKNFSISPYLGLGYRNLFNDLRGKTSTGALGYRRDSQYLYLPVGVTPRFRVTNDARVSINMEYDQLLQGWQTTSIGDATPGATDLNNRQHGGYGLRGSVMYQKAKWSAGPFFDYWNIDQSTINCDNVQCGFEPHNQTIEYGVQAFYRF